MRDVIASVLKCRSIESKQAVLRPVEGHRVEFDVRCEGKSFGSILSIVAARVEMRVASRKMSLEKLLRLRRRLLEADNVGIRRVDCVDHQIATAIAPIKVVRGNPKRLSLRV